MIKIGEMNCKVEFLSKFLSKFELSTDDGSSTSTQVTLLHPWIRRFTMNVSAWWFRTSSKFSGQGFEEIHRNIGLLETPLRGADFVQ